jgi:hypothetical protein
LVIKIVPVPVPQPYPVKVPVHVPQPYPVEVRVPQPYPVHVQVNFNSFLFVCVLVINYYLKLQQQKGTSSGSTTVSSTCSSW